MALILDTNAVSAVADGEAAVERLIERETETAPPPSSWPNTCSASAGPAAAPSMNCRCNDA